jgi:hypothetical protein
MAGLLCALQMPIYLRAKAPQQVLREPDDLVVHPETFLVTHLPAQNLIQSVLEGNESLVVVVTEGDAEVVQLLQ